MKSKVVLAFAALAILAAYLLWSPGSGAAPTPANGLAFDTMASVSQSDAEGESVIGAATAPKPIADEAHRTENPSAARPGIDIRVVWDDDSSPAADMQVFVTDERRWTSASHPDHINTTDEHGIARFPALTEGRYWIEGRFRAVSTPTVLTVDATSNPRDPFEVRILRGATVSGRVVDPEGHGIAGASVLRAGWAASWKQEIGVTDKDGRFSIEGLHGRISIGARARSFVPSVLWSMNLDEKTRESIDIVLQPAAAELSVKVVDSSGVPIAGARAGVGIFGRQSQPRRGADGRDEHIVPARASTDERGIAILGGLAPGTWELEVAADGHSGYVDEVEVPSHAGGAPKRIEREVVLPQPIVIAGAARDGSRVPIEGVFVGYGDHGHIVQANTRTAVDGTYRLTGAPAGEVRMHAQRKGLDRRETIRTLPGGEHRWDIEFAAERKVHGSVTWQDGSPVARAELMVASIDSKPRWHQFEYTNEQGRFVLDVPEHVTSVRVRATTMMSFARMVFEGPLPEGNLDIVLGPEHVASATLRGRIVDPDGKPIPGADLWYALMGQGGSMPIEVDAEGRFEQKVTPGTFNLRIQVAGFALADVRVEVSAKEERDLGDVRLEHAAALRVTIDGAPETKLTFWLTHVGRGNRTRLEVVNGQGSIGGLPGGKYRLQLCGTELASESHEVVLQAAPGGGDPTVLRLLARPATPLDIAITVAAGREKVTVVELEIRNAAGQMVAEHRAGLTADGRTYTKFALAPGSYELRARAGELSGRSAISVPRVSREPVDVVLELR